MWLTFGLTGAKVAPGINILLFICIMKNIILTYELEDTGPDETGEIEEVTERPGKPTA
jgi:hypothetical protein